MDFEVTEQTKRLGQETDQERDLRRKEAEQLLASVKSFNELLEEVVQLSKGTTTAQQG